jgi:hypothetical protein
LALKSCDERHLELSCVLLSKIGEVGAKVHWPQVVKLALPGSYRKGPGGKEVCS